MAAAESFAEANGDLKARGKTEEMDDGAARDASRADARGATERGKVAPVQLLPYRFGPLIRPALN